MSDAVLTLLKFGLMVVLYAFFAWVLWSGYNQLRRAPVSVAPQTAPQHSQASIVRMCLPAGSVRMAYPAFKSSNSS